MRMLVFGGRDFGWPKDFYASEEERIKDWEERCLPDRELFFEHMKKWNDIYTEPYDPCGKSAKHRMEIISGMAPGADSLAVLFAKGYNLKLHEYPADWKRYKGGAGPIRNQQMIDQGKPDRAIGFPGGSGTADMLKRLKLEGIPVEEVKRPIHVDQV